MPTTLTLATIIVLAIAGYRLGVARAAAMVGGGAGKLHSTPPYHGFYVALWAGLPALALSTLWMVLGNRIVMALTLSGLPERFTAGDAQSVALLRADILNLAQGIGVGREMAPELHAAAATWLRLHALGDWSLFGLGTALALMLLVRARRTLAPGLRTRNKVEKVFNWALVLCSMAAILTTLGIVLSLLVEALQFFTRVSPWDFLFGLRWSAQAAFGDADAGSYGAVPLFTGTMLITGIAMLVAVPVGLMAAVYLSEYASPAARSAVKPILEILAGIPTVVYGFFAAMTMAPFIRDVGTALGMDVSAQSALAAGVVMGVMIIPFISSLSDDVINAVPQSLRDGSYGLGATKSETIREIVIPAALPGIVGAVMLATSRAIGETMIVAMAAGMGANLTLNPLAAVTTVTVQIASTIRGDQEFNSTKTLSVFGLGLVLFFVTLALNVVALKVVQKYREKYD